MRSAEWRSPRKSVSLGCALGWPKIASDLRASGGPRFSEFLSPLVSATGGLRLPGYACAERNRVPMPSVRPWRYSHVRGQAHRERKSMSSRTTSPTRSSTLIFSEGRRSSYVNGTHFRWRFELRTARLNSLARDRGVSSRAL